MSTRWKAALAWIASMSLVWAIFVPRGISLAELVSVSVLGLVVLLKDEPKAVPVPVRMSKGPR